MTEQTVMRGLRPTAVAMVLLLLAPLLLVLPQPVAAEGDPPQFKATQDELLDEQLDAAGLVPMTAGSEYTCAIGTDGNAYCWGSNQNGRLGIGEPSGNRVTPTAVSTDVEAFTQLTAGVEHTCGLADDGTAYCWGGNGQGRLGDGSETRRETPTAVVEVEAFTQLTAGGFHTCGLDADGNAYCWGLNSSHGIGGGQLGTGDTDHRSTPTAVSTDVASFTQLTAGKRHTCGLGGEGTAWCWGANNQGQLGDGTSGVENSRATPTAVSTDTVATFTQLTAGGEHTCGLDADGNAYCWGSNGQGRLGDGSTENKDTPTAVSTGTVATFTQLTAGRTHTCGLDGDGTAYCWGRNDFGQLGDGTNTNRSTPTAVSTGTVATFTQLTAGDAHTCGVAADGGAWCWGNNGFGRLGDGTTEQRSAPAVVLAGAFPLPEGEQGPGGPPAAPSPTPAPVPELVVVPRVPGVGGGSIDGQETSLEVRPVVVDDQDTTADPDTGGQEPTGVEIAGEVDGNPFAIVLEPADEAGERGNGSVVGTQLRLTQGEGVRTRLFGFAPNSQARLSIFSEPRELGTFTTDGAGNLTAAVELLPDDITACQHTVQVTGTLTGGQQASAELGVWVLADPFPFADVATVSTHGPAIGCLTDLDGVVGFDGGDYDQQQPTTRGQAATILVRLLGLDPTAASFADAGATHAGSIGALEAAGILNGHTDGTVRPHTPLTRGQAASLLASAAGLADDPDAAAGFADAGTTHAGALGALIAADGISGFGDNTLRPDQPVTRGQYATMVVRLRDLLQPDPDNTTTD